MRRVVLALISSISIVGCTKKPAVETAPAGSAMSLDELVAKGEEVYRKNCIACHNLDPSKDGGVGPAIAGSSLALLEARVLKASYPEGYKPKRDTHTMPQMLHLKDDVGALAVFLNKK